MNYNYHTWPNRMTDFVCEFEKIFIEFESFVWSCGYEMCEHAFKVCPLNHQSMYV